MDYQTIIVNIVSPLVFVFIASFLFAKVEIAIEGSHGWAEKLPTWKLSEHSFVSRFFFGGKPATGYHVWMFLFMLFFIHAVYLFQPPSLFVELRLLALLILFFISEDFLWFVLNPAYGIKNFRKDKIWWHKDHWWWIAPRDYFIFVPFSLLLWVFSFLI
jgi:hypothetical protein